MHFCSGATRLSGRFNEGFSLRRLQINRKRMQRLMRQMGIVDLAPQYGLCAERSDVKWQGVPFHQGNGRRFSPPRMMATDARLKLAGLLPLPKPDAV
jgi:hypothetical protein